MPEQTRRYSIRIFDIEADRDVIYTVVDWTDEEKRAAVAQVVRLAGVPEGAGRTSSTWSRRSSRAHIIRMPRAHKIRRERPTLPACVARRGQRGPRHH